MHGTDEKGFRIVLRSRSQHSEEALQRIRQVLEYGISSWGTAAKANLQRVSKVQNQASRIMTGVMLVEQREAIQNKVVIFSGALSVNQALPNPQNTELNVLASVVSVL